MVPRSDSSCQAGEHGPVVPGQVLVQPGEPGGEGGGDGGVAVAVGDLGEHGLQAQAGVALQGLDVLRERGVHHPDGVDDDEPVLGLGVVGDGLEVGVVDDPDAPADHLLEVGRGSSPTRMNSRHSSGLTSVPVAIMSTVTTMRGFIEFRNDWSRSSALPSFAR